MSESSVKSSQQLETERKERLHNQLIGLARYAISVSSLTFILWYNASDFDITEYKTIGLMAAVLGGTELFSGWSKAVKSVEV